MTSTALHTSTQPEVARARKHSALRRWATTWGRAAVIAIAFAVQVLVFVAALTFFAEWSSAILTIQSALAIIVMLFILNGRRETTYQLAWIIPVLTVPLLGAVFYLFYVAAVMTRSQRARFDAATARAGEALQLLPAVGLPSEGVSASVKRQITYLENTSQYRIFDGTDTAYYPLGELGFDAMIEAIGAAKHYVFAEYFIVDGGKMIDRLIDALAAKAAQGLDVRFFTLPVDFKDRCESAGIAVIPV